MQDGFLLHVHSETALTKFILERSQKFSQFKKPIRFQPFAAIVGQDLFTIEKCYVILQSEDRYVVSSPAEALDITFKVITALNIQYPPESKIVWRGLQGMIYNIVHSFDSVDVIPQLVPIVKALKV